MRTPERQIKKRRLNPPSKNIKPKGLHKSLGTLSYGEAQRVRSVTRRLFSNAFGVATQKRRNKKKTSKKRNKKKTSKRRKSMR